MKGTIIDIQKFSLHDGPGIRTTIFTKGCNMHCLWCHNPESISQRKRIFFNSIKCISCGECFKACEFGALKLTDGSKRQYDQNICILCEKCILSCPSGALTFDSYEIDSDEIIKSVLDDKPYYDESQGGITISGGEPLLQADFVSEILRKCKENGISTAMESNVSFDRKEINKILPYLDRIYCDVKLFDNIQHIKYTGISNKKILSNIKYLASKLIPMTIRTPIIPAITDSKENIRNISKWISIHAPKSRYELLNYNPFVEAKFDRLGEKYILEGTKPKTVKEMTQLIEIVKNFDVDVVYRGT